MTNYRNDFDSVLSIMKALGDENRLRIFLCLGGEELCVCKLIAMLALAPSTVSKHLAILKQSGLIESSKRGRWIYYRRADANSFGGKLAEVLGAELGSNDRIRRDAQEICRLGQVNIDKLCIEMQAKREIGKV